MLSTALNAIIPANPRRAVVWTTPSVIVAITFLALMLAGCGEKTQGVQPPKVSAAFDAAAQAGQTALESDQAAAARDHFTTAQQVAAAEFPPNDPRHAMTAMYLGTALARSGNLAAAETELKKAVQLAAAHQPDDKSLEADIQFRLGDLYRQLGQADAADERLKQAAQTLPEKSAQNDLLRARILRSQALTQLLVRGQPAAAEPLFKAGVDKLSAVQAAQAAANPTAALGVRDELCALHNDYAACLLAQKKAEPARVELAAALDLEKDTLAGTRVAAETKQLLGRWALLQADIPTAITHFVAALEGFETSVGHDAPATFRAQHDLAEALVVGHNADGARAQYETYVTRYAALKRSPERGEPQAYAWVLNRLAGLYVQAEQLDKALATLVTLQQFYVAHAGAESPVVAQTCADRAVILKRLNRHDEAAQAETQAAAIRARQPAPANGTK